MIKGGKKLSRPPSITNTARSSLVITPISDPEKESKFKSLNMGVEELRLFGTRPLAHIERQFVEYLPESNASMHSHLPWEEELKHHSVARTAVAIETINHLNSQIRDAHHQASLNLAPHLKFLGPSHLEKLEKEARDLLKQSEEG